MVADRALARRPAERPRSDLTAEQSVLGAVLLDPAVLAEVRSLVRPEAFYSPAHAQVFAAMLEVADRGEPVDVVTVSGELARRERLNAVGGLQYLGSLTDATPTTAHVAAHARLVAEHFQARAVALALREQLAAIDRGETIDGLRAGLASALDLCVSTTARGARSYAQLANEWMTKIEETMRSGKLPGISTGWRALDDMLGGLQGGQMIVVGARPRMGKAQPLDARVCTPDGWRCIGDLRVGDLVTGASGKPTRVRGVFPRGVLPIFTVTTTDGAQTRCCDEHLWFTQTRAEARRGVAGSVRDLAEIRASLHVRGEPGRLNHRVPVVGAVEFAPRGPLPLHPYALGLLLGDGSMPANSNAVLHNPEPDLQRALAAHLPLGDACEPANDGITCRIKRAVRTGEPSSTVVALEALGLRGSDSFTKFIPEAYLRASIEDRVALLRGLFDTDGTVIGSNRIEYATSSPRLRDDVADLARGLGGIVRIVERVPHFTYLGERRAGALSWRMYCFFPGGLVPTASVKHALRASARGHAHDVHRSIKRIEPAGEAECVCIEVEADDHLYVTDDYLVTHNTAAAIAIAENAATKHGPVLKVSLEMQAIELFGRSAGGRGRVDGSRLRLGRISEEELADLYQACEGLRKLPIEVEDTPGLTLVDLAVAAARVKAKYGALALIEIDYLQLLQSSSKSEGTREQEVGEISRGLKRLAKRLDVPIVVLAQLNRACDIRSDHRPQLSDLRDSGAIEQDADAVMFLYRDEVYDKDSADKGIAEFIIAKQRNGPEGTVRLAWEGKWMRFADLEREASDEWEEGRE